MKRVALLVALALLAGLTLAPAVAGEKKTHEMTAEVVSVDAAAKTITIKDEKGEQHTAPVLAEALASLGSVKAGDKITVTCLDNEKGEHQGVTAIKPAKASK